MKKWILIVVFLGTAQFLHAQRGPYDTIRVGTIVVGQDTFIHKWLREVYVTAKIGEEFAKLQRRRRAEQEAYSRLRYNVYVVYPYAIKASFILQDVDSMLNVLNSKVAKQEFKRRKEDELNRKFKHELEDLSISQGQILVKLIARQTGRPCYNIIKDLKGGFNAAIFQAMALLFDNNLKNNYDPMGDDANIEQIVLEIEASGHFVKTY